jgi:hypothetical protein
MSPRLGQVWLGFGAVVCGLVVGSICLLSVRYGDVAPRPWKPIGLVLVIGAALGALLLTVGRAYATQSTRPRNASDNAGDDRDADDEHRTTDDEPDS